MAFVRADTVRAGQRLWTGILVGPCGCSSMVELQLPKLRARVRFPSPAPSFSQPSAISDPCRTSRDLVLVGSCHSVPIAGGPDHERIDHLAPPPARLRRRAQAPLGRWQAHDTGPDGAQRRLGTFPTKAEADQTLAHEVSRMARGVWRDPRLGGQPVGECLRGWIQTRGDLAPSKRDAEVPLPSTCGSRRWGGAPRGAVARIERGVVVRCSVLTEQRTTSRMVAWMVGRPRAQ